MRHVAVRLWTGMMVLVAVMAALLWLFQVVYLEQTYTNAWTRRITQTGQLLLERMLADPGYPDDMDTGLLQDLDEFVFQNGGAAELLDADGKRLILSGGGERSDMPLENNAQKLAAVEQARTGERVTLLIAHPRFQSDYILAGLPASIEGRPTGALILLFPLAPIEKTTDFLKVQLAYITSALLAISVAVAYMLSRSFTRPIREITAVSLRMASGDYDARIDVGRKDEIGRLAETVNYLGSELKRDEALRRELIANVSHELRTPLSLVKGYAETLRDVTGADPAKRERQLGIIVEETDRLSGLVTDLLDMSQLQAGYLRLVPEDLDLQDFAADILEGYALSAAEKGVALKLECAGGIRIRADAMRMAQVLHNLLSNALRHTESGGSIVLSAKPSPENSGRVRVEVEDNGAGIPADRIGRIWDRFYRGETAGAPNQGPGLGLGLAIVRGIFDAHGFPYGVESKTGDVGHGAVFWFEPEGVSESR